MPEGHVGYQAQEADTRIPMPIRENPERSNEGAPLLINDADGIKAALDNTSSEDQDDRDGEIPLNKFH